MRLSQFQELMTDEFGPSQAAVLLADFSISSLGGQTGNQAIEAGVDPREVWLALCQAMDVPKERWAGKPQKNKKSN